PVAIRATSFRTRYGERVVTLDATGDLERPVGTGQVGHAGRVEAEEATDANRARQVGVLGVEEDRVLVRPDEAARPERRVLQWNLDRQRDDGHARLNSGEQVELRRQARRQGDSGHRANRSVGYLDRIGDHRSGGRPDYRELGGAGV